MDHFHIFSYHSCNRTLITSSIPDTLLMLYLLLALCITSVQSSSRWKCDPATESCPEWNTYTGEYLIKFFSSSGTCTGTSSNYVHVSPALGCKPGTSGCVPGCVSVDNGADQPGTSIRGSCDAVNRYVVMYTYKSSNCTGVATVRYRDQSNFNPLPDSACSPNKCAGMSTTLSIKNGVCQCSEDCATASFSFLNECTNRATTPSPASASAPAPVVADAPAPATTKKVSASTRTTVSVLTFAVIFGVTITMIEGFLLN